MLTNFSLSLRNIGLNNDSTIKTVDSFSFNQLISHSFQLVSMINLFLQEEATKLCQLR